MQYKLLHESGGQRTFAVVLKSGEEALATLQSFVKDRGITAAQITAIGAFSDVTLLYFDWAKKDYTKIPVPEQVEVASLIGDVAQGPSAEPALQMHVVVGRRGGSAMAGHLGEGHVPPTLEVIITESPAHLLKTRDESMIPKSGNRFSEKIMLKQKARSGMTVRRKVIPLWETGLALIRPELVS